jgi:hypothetical protein
VLGRKDIVPGWKDFVIGGNHLALGRSRAELGGLVFPSGTFDLARGGSRIAVG